MKKIDNVSFPWNFLVGSDQCKNIQSIVEMYHKEYNTVCVCGKT